MILSMYSICDKLADFVYPFPAYSDQAAVRNFAAEINGNPVAKNHPADFDLFRVGKFDTTTGLIESEVPNVHIQSGVNVIYKDVE